CGACGRTVRRNRRMGGDLGFDELLVARTRRFFGIRTAGPDPRDWVVRDQPPARAWRAGRPRPGDRVVAPRDPTADSRRSAARDPRNAVGVCLRGAFLAVHTGPILGA